MKKYKDPKYGGSLAVPDKEVAKIVDAIMNKRTCKRKSKYFYFCRIRDSMMIILQSFLGVRQRNVLEIELGEIDIEARTLYIPSLKSKTRQQEILIVPRCVIPALVRYLEVKNKIYPESKWLFPSAGTRDGRKKVDSNTYMKIFRDALKLAGLYQVNYIDKLGHRRANRTTHGLRKGGATKVWLVTGDPMKVAIYLTHTDARMTSTFRYIQAAKEQVRENICDEVFDMTWRDPAKIQKQTQRLIKLLELSHNKKVPVVKI